MQSSHCLPGDGCKKSDVDRAVEPKKMTKQEPPMSKYTAFRCPEDLLELAKVKAKKDRRSLSNYIITLIEKDVRELSLDEDARSKRRAG